MYTQVSDIDMMKTMYISFLKNLDIKDRMDFLTKCLFEAGATEFSVHYPLDDGGSGEITYKKESGS
jgi:hypothetical protein